MHNDRSNGYRSLGHSKVLDRLIASNSKDGSFLLEGILIIASLFLLKEILNCLRIRTNNKLEQKVILRLRSDLHAKLLNLPIGFYDKRKSGDIASRVVEEASKASNGPFWTERSKALLLSSPLSGQPL